MNKPKDVDIQRAIQGMVRSTDGFPWYWLSYGEKCYAFATVEAAPVREGDAFPDPGTMLNLHPERPTWIGANGTEMMVMGEIAAVEQQNGGVICEFIALAHASLMWDHINQE